MFIGLRTAIIIINWNRSMRTAGCRCFWVWFSQNWAHHQNRWVSFSVFCPVSICCFTCRILRIHTSSFCRMPVLSLANMFGSLWPSPYLLDSLALQCLFQLLVLTFTTGFSRTAFKDVISYSLYWKLKHFCVCNVCFVKQSKVKHLTISSWFEQNKFSSEFDLNLICLVLGYFYNRYQATTSLVLLLLQCNQQVCCILAAVANNGLWSQTYR